MPSEFRVPSLGPDMEEGTLVEWRIKPGDAVKRGDVVALVETDKGVIDVEIFAAGIVERLLVDEGARVPVGTVLATLAGEGAEQAVAAVPDAAPAKAVSRPDVVLSAQVRRDGERLKVSPAARVKAGELGVDLSKVAGTGMGHTVTVDDVVRASAQPQKAEETHDMRQVIARAMARSKREIPHYYLSVTCSFAAARDFLDRHNQSVGIESRLLPSVIILKALARAAKAMPEFNGFYRNDAFEPSSQVHVGMAIAMRGGRLVAPAMIDTDCKSLTTLMLELRDLTTRVRSGHMRSSELSMPTITLTSLAEEGIDCVMPVIYPPQVTIVGVGSIVDRPWVVDGHVVAQPVVSITVAADHRVTDGRAAARFLARIRDELSSPEQL